MSTKRKRRAATQKRSRPAAPTQRPRHRGRLLLAALLGGGLLIAVSVLLLARDDSGTRSAASTDADLVSAPDPGPVHVHGLGLDPADGALLVATHSGLYRLPSDGQKALRVGRSRQDTMGFTVAGPNAYLGSGHPDPQEAVARDLPPHLGLIESRDGGRTWRNVSLLGEADFHVLRVAAARVYGYDASNDRLLISRDGGRTWGEAARPAPVADLAVDPQDPRRVIASAAGGVYLSGDDASSWTRVAPHVGLLAWPAPERLYLVDAEGIVRHSRDGRAWTRVGSVGGPPAAFLAATPAELYVALHDGSIVRSRDAGRTWSVRARP